MERIDMNHFFAVRNCVLRGLIWAFYNIRMAFGRSYKDGHLYTVRKSVGLSMGILSNGCRTRRSLSPVIIQEAWADTARERYLSSFGSRHAVIVCAGLIEIELLIIFSMKSIRVSIFTHLLNFSREKTITYSATISS